MSSRVFRLADSGLRTGRQNIALDQAMVDAHQAGEIPDTLRFIHFHPTALVGRHQALSQETNISFCNENGIELGRRLTGGGAIYMDQNILGWSIVCGRESLGGGTLPDITARLCEAVAAGLQELGLNAQFRPRNDIEVEGRKISGTGGFFDGSTLIYQGTVLVGLDTNRMFGALNVARDKLASHGIEEAARRVTSVTEELGRTPNMAEVCDALTVGIARKLGIEFEKGDITENEETRADIAFRDEIGTEDFVREIDDPARESGVLTGAVRGPGGQVAAHLRLEGPQNNRVREVLFTGDFFVTPPRIVFDLESHLRSTVLQDIPQAIEKFFEQADVGLLSVQPIDFAGAIEAASHARAEPV